MYDLLLEIVWVKDTNYLGYTSGENMDWGDKKWLGAYKHHTGHVDKDLDIIILTPLNNSITQSLLLVLFIFMLFVSGAPQPLSLVSLR